jgi:site-specific recombinase XerD
MGDVHDYQRRLDKVTEKVKGSGFDAKSRSLMLEFDKDCAVHGISAGRRAKYLYMLLYIRRTLRKPFRQVSKKDIIGFIDQLHRSKYAEWTRHDFKVVVKKFFRFMKGIEKKGVYPEEVEWISTTLKNRNNMPAEQVLTEEEVRRLAEAVTNARDRAIVLALYESGCRVGEFLALKIKDINFDEYGAVLLVDGKTGRRRVRIIASAPAVAGWLQVHPIKDNPDAFVWVSMATNYQHEWLTYGGLNALLRELAKRSKVAKRVNPHSFRHARATHLANKLTEAQMKELFGWVQASDMASVYVHLSGRDVDHALLELHGLAAKDQKEDKLKVKVCPRCQEKNSPVAVYCGRCALPLDTRAMEWESTAMEGLLGSPQVKKYLEKVIKERYRRQRMLSKV